MLSKLKDSYPYFLNVHSLLECDYVSRNQEKKKGQVMVVDKGSETIYNYLNRKSKEYILHLIPDLETKVNELDTIITKIIDTQLTSEEKKFEYYVLEQRNQEKYNLIILTIDNLVKDFYLSLSKEIIQFQTEFIPLFLKNYKTLIDSYMIVDIFILNKYNNFIIDKKSDNFMVQTEPYVENKTHVNIKLNSTDIKINNVCEWYNTKEYCFLYPVDFGSGGNMDHPKLHTDLLPYFLNRWIYHYSNLKLYSDVKYNNLESGNILLLSDSNIEFKFSKFSSNNTITKLNIDTIFNKYNPFKIKICNPLMFYIEGMLTKFNETDSLEFKEILEKNQLEDNDYRFQSVILKLFNINTLEEACEILQILLNGKTVIYDNFQKKYREHSNILNFNNANGLPNKLNLLYDSNVYKNFIANI